MKFKTLTITDFKNLDFLKFEFSDINLISGNNGSGKSSVFQAIQYLLTDSLTEKLSEYIRWGKEEFKIHLTFEHLGEEYEYFVKYSSSSSKELRIGSQVYKNSDASKKLKELINSDLLLYSCFSEQGQSYSILTESPSERLKRFKTILGIDRLTDIVENLKTEIKSKKSESDNLENEIMLLQSKLKVDFLQEISVPNIQQVKNELEKLELEKQQKDEYDEIIKIWKIRKEAQNKIENRKNELQTLIESLKTKIYNLKSVDFNLQDYQKLLVQKQSEELEFQKYQLETNKYNSYLKQLSFYNQQKDDIQKKISDLKLVRIIPLNFTKDQLGENKQNLIQLEVSLKEVNNHIELSREGKCPTCGQEFKHSFEELELQKIDLTNRIKSLREEITIQSVELENYNRKVEENKQVELRKEEYQNEILKIQKKLEEVVLVNQPEDRKFNFEFLNNEIQKLTELKIQYEKQEKDTEVFQNQILKYEGEYQGLQVENIEDCPEDKKFNYDVKLHEELKKEINIYDQKTEELKRIQDYNSKLEQDLQKTKLTIKEKEVIYYSIVEEVRDLEDSKNILEKQFSSYLIEAGTSFVESQMCSFFQKCYPRYSVYFKQTENRKSIDFYYSDSGDKIVPASMASGFEKQLLSIAFRVALASITGLNILILDEVDSDASDDNSQKLYTNLIEANLFSQFLCITHKETTKNMLVNDYHANLISLEN